jgi:predicted nucleotidyltransferase
MKGGKADKLTLPQIAKKHGVPIEDLMSQFKLGVKTEMEHTDNKKQAKEIASDHLAENPKYYTKLKKAKLEEAIAKSLVTAALGLGLMGNTSVSKGNQAIPLSQQQQQNQDKLPKKVSFSRSESISNPDLDLVHGALGSKRLKEMGELDFSQVVNNELKKQFNQGKKADENLKEEALPKKLKTDIEIEYHKNLNPQFWLNNHLKSGIRKNLLNLAKFYFKQLDLGVELKDIIFTGSLANYNYTDLSDIDIHIIIDYKKLTNDDEFAKEFFSNKRSIWADSNEIKVNGFPVEIYVQDVSQLDDKGMGAMYSLLNNKWIKKPKYKLPQVEKHLITTKVNKYLDILNKISMMDDSIKKVEAYNKVFEKMRTDRKKATQKEGEFSVDNLVFKVLRNKGVFDIIKNNKKEIVNNLFSMKTN